MAFRLPKTDQQYVIKADASFYVAGYVLMIEDYTVNDMSDETKIYAPVTFGLKIFQKQINLSSQSMQKPVLILNDNRSVTRFRQTKKIPTALRNALNHVLSFHTILGHIPGKANLAADYLSRIHRRSKKNLSYK